jgi:hypothetical protein
MTLDDWLNIGWDNGWCSPPVCASHDGVPLSEPEAEDWDVCVTVVRIYTSPEMRREVENDHPPSVWRARELGWINS